MSTEMMWQTTMSPESRRLIQVLPEDVEKTQFVFDMLLGEDIKERKRFIAEYGHKYMDMTDVS